jgi:hypothetical protein
MQREWVRIRILESGSVNFYPDPSYLKAGSDPRIRTHQQCLYPTAHLLAGGFSKNMINLLKYHLGRSVPDPWHFGVDPDPFRSVFVLSRKNFQLPHPDPVSEVWIRGSGSTPKCHRSRTLGKTKTMPLLTFQLVVFISCLKVSLGSSLCSLWTWCPGTIAVAPA